MRVCLSSNGKHVPAAYKWCEDALTPDIDGTVVHVRHDVDGVLVYVRSDNDLRGIAAYAASDLLHVVTPAHNEWAALLTFVRQHTTCR